MAAQDKPQKGDALRKGKKSAKAYLKYSGMGIQMGIIIAVFSFAGVKLDAYLKTEPLFTATLSLFGVGASLYLFLKQLLVENKSEIEEEMNDDEV